MRLLRKILLNLTIIIVFVIILYCLQTSNGAYWSINNFKVQNATQKTNLPSTLMQRNKSSDYVFIERNTNLTSSMKTTRKEYYNIWCIFTKITNNSPMRRKFKIFIESLLKFTSVEIFLHVISDTNSKSIAEKVIQVVQTVLGKKMKVQFYDVHKLAAQLEDVVSVMSPHFSSKPGTYYSDALFFLSLGLHRIAPPEQNIAIMFDADTKFRTDVKEIFKEFDNFGDSALFGLAPELSPVYRHVLYLYRSKNPKTIFGDPGHSGGYPGYNSGVILLNLDRLRKSLEYDQIVSRDMVEHIVEKYYFKGHLGDQDFYTLLGMERPELIHTIDCGWNRQLCTWWRDRGYADVFANYSQCDSKTKLWHENCNSPIPDD